MNSMNTKEFSYIITLAKEKSITRAAERLFLTQPAPSLFLTRLERELGVPLFHRSRGGLKLTFAGKKYVDMAQRVLELERGFQQDLSLISQDHMGEIKVGASAHIGSLILPRVITRFNREYPNMEVQIVEGPSGALEKMIQERSIDIALMHLPLKSIQARYVPILKDRYILAFHKDNPLAAQIFPKEGFRFPFMNPRKLQGQKFILAHPYQRVRQISERILTHAGIIPDIFLVTSSVQTALRFCGENLGVTFLPESYLQLFRYSPNLRFCYMEDRFEAYWTFVLVLANEHLLSEPLRHFIRITQELFGEERNDAKQ